MTSITRNLLIPLRSNLSMEDWSAIGSKIGDRAPDIEVRIASDEAHLPDAESWQVTRPSVVFSPDMLGAFKPRGGTIFAGQSINKLNQAKSLHAIGVLVPPTILLTPQLSIDPEIVGEFVVTKPPRSARGIGITLVRTSTLANRYAELTDGGRNRMLVQPYIDHTEDGYPTEFRALTMLGKVLYCARNRWGERRRPLREIADTDGLIASNTKTKGGRIRAAVIDEDVIALAERASTAFPGTGVLGVDIIREARSRALFVLEVNPSGKVWHLSSGLGRTFDPDHRRDLYAQFDALDRAADLLVARTRAEAS